MAEASNETSTETENEASWEEALQEQNGASPVEEVVESQEPESEEVVAESTEPAEVQESFESAAEETVLERDKSEESEDSSDDIEAFIASRRGARPRTHEVPVSTIVSLMGVSSKSDVRTLETKIDSLGTKVTNLSNRLERVTDQLMELFNDIDRTNTQFGDLKHFLKNILSSVVADSSSGVSAEQIDAIGEVDNSEKEPEQSAEDESVNVISSE